VGQELSGPEGGCRHATDHDSTGRLPDRRRSADPVHRQRHPAGADVLLTSPWPESVYAFAPIWAPLAEHARLFAVDLPGFGASERREELLSPQAMGEFLVRLIAEASLGTPHLVAPDVGTAAALFAGSGEVRLSRPRPGHRRLAVTRRE